MSRVLELRADQIRPMAGQPRRHFDDAKLALLAQSLDEDEQAVPIVVRRTEGALYELISGERRWRAVRDYCKRRRTLTALVVEASDATAFRRAVAENENREALHPLERGRALQRLIDLGATIEEAARIAGISMAYVYQLTKLLDLHPDALALMDPARPEKDRLPLNAAIALSSVPLDMQPDIARLAVERGVRMMEVRAAVDVAMRASGRAGGKFSALQTRRALRTAIDRLGFLVRSRLSTDGEVRITFRNDPVRVATTHALRDLAREMALIADRIERL